VANGTPAALKLKTCKAWVRDVSVKEGRRHCGKQYLGDRCPDKDGLHLLPFPTGFCNNGWCEGSKKTDWRGKPVPTCEFIYTCPCKCHADLDKLFALTNKERIVVDASGYTTPERTFWLPSDDPVTPLSSPNGTTAPVIIESPIPDRVPAHVARTFDPTPSGRTARGELEMWVKHHCDVWLIDEPGEMCTPVYLAKEIGHDHGIMPPSVGAIGAVFNRWVDLGFAVCEKKPVRFVRYTEQGIKLGLERMKADAKKNKKLQRNDDRRNLRR
jgi:hypothetical protein